MLETSFLNLLLQHLLVYLSIVLRSTFSYVLLSRVILTIIIIIF